MENINKRSRGVRENNDHQDDDEDEAEAKRSEMNNSNNIMRLWHTPSSRIYRVSRASGGKDRHSKVYTSKGLRDRRVRLSVSTAIQFYDLQDRLGYDQPSKAIEWLIKAAQSAIDELPSLDTNFPHPMDHNLNVDNRLMVGDSVMDPEAEPSYNNNQQQQHSSTSETSKGSVLSLSRSEIRVKARERARERVKDKEKDGDDVQVGEDHRGLNTQGSFTKLLTGGSSGSNGGGQASSSATFIQKQQMQHNLLPVSATADFFNGQSGFSSQGHFGMVPLPSNGNAGDHSNEMQQFAFMHDHFFPVAASHTEGDYNLNFSISPGFAGFHRGTLQSNSPSHHHHNQLQLSHLHNHNNHHQVQAQRLSLALDGSSVPVPLFFGTAANAAAAANNDNQYSSGFDGQLQLDAYKNLELKGKGKS